MRSASLFTLATLLLGASLAAQSPAPDSTVASEPGPSLVFVAAGRSGPALSREWALPSMTVASRALADDTLKKKPRAVQHSDAYYTRLTIHRWASYTMPPLFVGQYLLGQELIRKRDSGEDYGSVQGLHSTVAGAIAGLFVVNTVTGAWNWYEDRGNAEGRTRRTVHAVTMLIVDAGFIATGATASDDGDEGGEGGEDDDGGSISTHRNLAYGSMALALASGAMMWFWKD